MHGLLLSVLVFIGTSPMIRRGCAATTASAISAVPVNAASNAAGSSISLDVIESQMRQLQELQEEQRKAEAVARQAVINEQNVMRMHEAMQNHRTLPQKAQHLAFALMNGAWIGAMAAGYMRLPSSMSAAVTAIATIGTVFLCFMLQPRHRRQRRRAQQRRRLSRRVISKDELCSKHHQTEFMTRKSEKTDSENSNPTIVASDLSFASHIPIVMNSSM